MASFSDAIELSQTTGLDINDTGGVFGRVGWADGQVEPWDLTDIDQTFQAGGSITGKEWGGLTIRSARSVYQWHQQSTPRMVRRWRLGHSEMLPKYSLAKIFKTYYSYAVTPTLKLSADCQFVADPGYNAQRGPVLIFGLRLHAEF